MKNEFKKVDYDSKFTKLGNAGEATILDVLQIDFPNVRKYSDFFSVFDYCEKDENKNLLKVFELKTRNCSINTYPDFVFGKNKLDKADRLLSRGIRCFFMWYLLDENDKSKRQLYYWEYTARTLPEDFRVGLMGNPHIGQKPKPAIFVYTKHLTKYDYHKISSA